MARLNKSKTQREAERLGVTRWVTLICTGQGAGGHPRRVVGRVGLADGAAVRIDDRNLFQSILAAAEKRDYGKTAAPFQFYCDANMTCHRSPQLTAERMKTLVQVWLEVDPDSQSVVRDISDPETARLM